jgi:hypothetical protein
MYRAKYRSRRTLEPPRSAGKAQPGTARPGRYLVRSGSVYIFQIRVPKDLSGHALRPIRVSLGALTARVKADLMAAHARHCFDRIRARRLANGQDEDAGTAGYGQGAPQFSGETAGEVRATPSPPSRPEAMDAETLLELARAHRQIENRLFRVRDGTFAEDACRVRTGNAPVALAHLRNASLTLIRKRKLKPKPAREAFAANPKAAIRAVISARIELPCSRHTNRSANAGQNEPERFTFIQSIKCRD